MAIIDNKNRNDLYKELISYESQCNNKIAELDEYIDFVFELEDDMDSLDNQNYVNRNNNDLKELHRKVFETKQQIQNYEKQIYDQELIINTFINEILSGVDIDVERVCSFDIEDILAFLKRKVRKQELSLLEANKIKEVFVNILKLNESKKHK